MAELLLQPVGADTPGHCGSLRRRLDALHEGGVLLDEGRVHFGWVGPSCSTHNPWPVDPDPRGAGQLEARLKAEPASGHSLQAPAQTSVRSRSGGPVTETPDRAARTPDSLPQGPVSTVLTLTGSASVHPAGIVGILRFLSGVQPRFGVNVSAVDTTLVTPHPFGPLASWTTSLPRVPARVSVSEVRRQHRFHQPRSQPHGEVHRQRSSTLCHPSRPRHRPASIWTVTGHPTPPLLRRRRRCGAR